MRDIGIAPVVRVSMLLCLLTCTRCLPIPHPEDDTPEIQGIVFSAGHPLSHRRVAVSLQHQRLEAGQVVGDLCNAPILETVTDDGGAFSLPATSHFTPFFFIVGDRFAQWNFCIESDGVLHAALSRKLGGTPHLVHLSCVERTGAAVECVIKS